MATAENIDYFNLRIRTPTPRDEFDNLDNSDTKKKEQVIIYRKVTLYVNRLIFVIITTFSIITALRLAGFLPQGLRADQSNEKH